MSSATTTVTSSNTSPNQNGNVNGFLIKLWKLLENSCDNTIVWSDDGRSFIISDPHAFSNSLSKYFKHSKLSSFIRQLNMYGFRKVTSNINWTAGSDIKVEDDLHFYHPNFRRGEQNQLALIRRKMPNKFCNGGANNNNGCNGTNSNCNGNNTCNANNNCSSNSFNGNSIGSAGSAAHHHTCHDHSTATNGVLENVMNGMHGDENNSGAQTFDLNELRNALNEVRILDVRQTETSNSLVELKHENETLWTELLDLRSKYNEQRDIITTLIKFIVDSIQSRFPVSKNRKISNLMIGNQEISDQLQASIDSNNKSNINNQSYTEVNATHNPKPNDTNNQSDNNNIPTALIVPPSTASASSSTSSQSTNELSTWLNDQLVSDANEACGGLDEFMELFGGDIPIEVDEE